ncbi:uncharacterized protein EAE98_010614 [Botrytis deweyae]|uniref:Uncharacterized protein n=1 Tax=Botrytis deweyae TaxID=2478750 RepID=A0ABQ7I8H8_9HELO|nr:uncharacterized protein EAE98_010614 [Botrytis deweyae]KAF7916605.1 hypothetical protein EAE98_010614 [Botrytis deweyae]
MTPLGGIRYLIAHAPREALGDSEQEIQESISFLEAIEWVLVKTERERMDRRLNYSAQDIGQRHITSTDATNNHEATEEGTASVVTKKEGVQGNVTEEVAIEVFHEDLVKKSTADEKVAKKPDCEDIVVDGVTEQSKIGDSVQADLLLLGMDMEDDAEKNNIEKGVIARNVPGILMNNYNNSDANDDFENSGAYYHIILKMDCGDIDEKVVKAESEDNDDGQALA